MQRRITCRLFSESKTAFAGTKNIVRRSPAQKQRNFAVAVEENVSSDPEIKKRPKRVSRNERRSLVESFVNNFRAVNSGNFPTPSCVIKNVGGSYYFVRNIVQELQHKSQIRSTGTSNDDAMLEQKGGFTLGKPDTINNADAASEQEGGPHSDMEEKTLLDDIDSSPTIALIKSVKKNKLENEDGLMSNPIGKASSDELVTRTLGTKVEVEEVELTAHKVDGQTLPLHYPNFSEETEQPSTTADNYTHTPGDRYLLEEENKDSCSAMTISQENRREEAMSKIDQQEQSSVVAKVTRDMPEEHGKKGGFKWSLKSLADGFIRRIWGRS